MSTFLTNIIITCWLENREQTIDLSRDATAVSTAYKVAVLSKHPDSTQLKTLVRVDWRSKTQLELKCTLNRETVLKTCDFPLVQLRGKSVGRIKTSKAESPILTGPPWLHGTFTQLWESLGEYVQWMKYTFNNALKLKRVICTINIALVVDRIR